jgi:hypothetical protein
MTVLTGSTKATVVRFGVQRGSDIVWLGSDVQAVNEECAEWDGTVWIAAEYRPMCRVFGGTLGESLTLYAFGYLAEDI